MLLFSKTVVQLCECGQQLWLTGNVRHKNKRKTLFSTLYLFLYKRSHKHVLYVMIHVFILLCVDGVDGKQARRTNSSTPLGELFDHGLDSWACIFFVATVYSIFGRGESGVAVATLYYILWVVLFSFILSHWEKYNTGILFLPWGYDISQVVRTHTDVDGK